MKSGKKRELLLKVVNRELKQYLKAFDKSHPYYKRNIKNLYEGLNELGILTDIPNSDNFKQFKEAFSKADKGLKQALVVAYIYEDTNLGHYFSYQGKPLNRVKMLGNVFVSQIANPKLDERGYINYREKQAEREKLIKDKQDLKEMLKGLLEDKKELQRQLKKAQKELKVLNKLATKKIKLETKDTKKLLNEQKLTTKLLDKYEPILKAILRSHGFFEGDSLAATGVTLGDLSSRIEDRLYEALSQVSNLQVQNEKDLEQYEILSRQIVKDVKLKGDIDNDRLKWLGEKIRLVQNEVHTKATTKINEAIPNVVKGLTDIINLEKQLHKFLHWLDNKRMSLSDPWRVMGYGSGGVDKRSGKTKALASLALQVGVDPQHVEKTLGDTSEGFWKRDFNYLTKELVKFEDLFYSYEQLIEGSNLKESVKQTVENTGYLIGKLLEPCFDPEHVVRDQMGHILNIDEHEGAMRMFEEVQAFMGHTIKGVKDAIAHCRQAVEYNENLIAEAKATKKSAMKQVIELGRIQKGIDKLGVRRDIREKEADKSPKRDKDGLIDGMYGQE